MRDFDPLRIASEWHSGQGSALYAYASTDRIPTEQAKDRLVSEIERAMAAADDEQLDELEYLLMHVEESHPDQYPGSEMHEADDEESATKDDDSDWKPGKFLPKSEKKVQWEGDGMTCESCGGMTSEGSCDCSMAEGDEPSTYDYDGSGMSLDAKRSAAAERGRKDARPYVDYNKKPTEDLDEVELDWPKQAASKVKDVAMMDVGGPKGVLTPAERASQHGKPNGKESDPYKVWKQKRSARKAESVLRQAIASILGEMKLSVAGRNHFDFGGAEEMNVDDVAHMLLGKKDSAPEAPKSGVRAKEAKPKASKRKSKKTA